MQQLITNTGSATAFDIIVQFKPGLSAPNSREPQDGRKEVSILNPGQSLAVDGIMSTNIHDTVFFVTVSWADAPGRKARYRLSYNFKASDGFRAGWRRNGLHEISETLEKFQRNLDGVISGSRRLNVDTFVEKDRTREAAEREAWYEEQSSRQVKEADLS